MKRKQIKFLFFFQETPFTPDVPLKALTSQGKRFDVACRIIKSVLSSNDDHPETSVECWFAEGKLREKPVHLIINGDLVPEETRNRHFFSELAIARFLKSEITNHVRNYEEDISCGIKMTFFPVDSTLKEHFINSLETLKSDEYFRMILLEEGGEPIFRSDEKLAISVDWGLHFNFDKLAFIIGDQAGFPDDLGNGWKTACHSRISLGTGGKSIEQETSTVSYLGSQVVQMLRFILE
ncbi:MAG: hypothetical protein ACFFCS_19155 [Candidatus Hodarchaeota archaeon]